jgi:hypothetical protein
MEILMAKNRSMVKLLHADGFFPNNDAENLRNVVKDLDFVKKEYGYELPNFNLIFPDVELIFNSVLGERVTVDPKRSGIVRKPFSNSIHFENFDSPNEWCFIVALEPTTINLWYHIEDSSMGELSKADSKNVFNGSQFNYTNLFEWKIVTNMVLEQNEGIFIRPWVFHSLDSGIVQYYRLIADDKYRVLVMGYPGSKKDSISTKLSEKFEDCLVIDSMKERIKAKDVDFSVDGHMRHCYRILNQARASTSKVTIINMATPLSKMRQIINPDILIWVSDKTECEYEDVNKMYEMPQLYDIECKDDSDETINSIIKRIVTKRI